MGAPHLLVELCAGSAAVSLAALRRRARPPLGFQGSKQGYAAEVLAALNVRSGEPGLRCLWVEPGPWGEAWQLWRERGVAGTVSRLEAWSHENPLELWQRLRDVEIPENVEERVATWTALQFWSWGKKPILAADDAWTTHGFNSSEAYATERRDQYLLSDRRLPHLVAALRALPDLSRVEVLRRRAEEVEPVPGALVLLDPPYAGTTCCYGFDLPRASVLDVAARWRTAGARVVVCEAEPLPLPGWHHHELGRPKWRGRAWSRQRREWLTTSFPPYGQLWIGG